MSSIADLTPDETVAEHNGSQPFGMGTLNSKMGVELLHVSVDKVIGRMPVDGNQQPYGILHGGASVVLAETLGSTGSAIHARSLDKLAVGVDINATHHRSAATGWVLGTATPAYLGKSASTWDVVITNDEGKRICTSRITCSLVPAERFS